MTGERKAKQRRLEKSAADGLREQMRSSWPRVLTFEDDGTGENHVKLCVEHDAPHDHCALECWNLQGLIGENERFGLFVSFSRHAVTGEEELSDGEGSVTYAAEVSWVIVDHEKKKYYRFSELDHRAPIMAAYLAADGGITGDEYFLQALSEQFSQNRLPLPDRVMKGTTSLHTDMLDLQYGDNRLTVIPKKTGKKSTSFSWYKLSLSGTTFETGDADPQREVRVVVELTLKPTQPAVLHGNKGVVGLKDDWGHDMFHYLIPHCMVVEGTFRMMRASDDLEIARCPDLKGAKLWMSHSFGCAVPRNISESNYLRKQSQQCGYLPHFWNCCVIHLDNETADAIGVVYALDPAHWKPVDIYLTLQSGTTGTIEHQHEGVELVAKSTSQHRSDATGILFTTQWTLITPFRDDAKLEVLLDATFPDQEFTTLFAQPSVWLGAVQVSGKIVASDGTSTGVTGKGFLQCCGKDGLNNVKKMHDMLREVSTARMEYLEVGVRESLNEMVSSFAASATSNVKTLMSLQGQTLSDAHLVLFASFLGVYGYIFHHPTEKKEALEAIQWCHGKWLGYFGNAYIDVKTLMLRSFMLRELSYVLKSRCASWIPTHMQVIDLVAAPPSNINAVMGTDNCSEEEVVPSLPHFGTSPSKLDLSQLRANFSGKWTLDSTRGTDNISAFLSAQGVHVLWRNLIANTPLNLIVTFDEEKQMMRFNHRRSFWGREFVIQLDGSYGEQRCASRGTIRSRACVFPGGTGVCIEKKISDQMIERDWYTFEDGGGTMVEVMRLYSDKAAENKKDSPSVLPISNKKFYRTGTSQGFNCNKNKVDTAFVNAETEAAEMSVVEAIAAPAASAIDSKFLDKQSRTIGTYGLETMVKLISFKVLIVGCGGVGIEAAKNLSMAGVHTIILCDPAKAQPKDMGVNFAVTEAAVRSGLTRAEASQRLVSELNPNVRVRVVDALSEAVVSQVNALVFTSAAPDYSLRTLKKWNKFCHDHSSPISFIFAFQGGALGSVFADHGAHFTVKDPDGRPMLQKSIVEVITKQDKTGTAYTRIRYETPEGQTPGALRDYTRFKFTEVRGLCKANGESVNDNIFNGVMCPNDPRDTVRIYPSLESQGYSAYETGGFLHELKEVFQIEFRTLEEAVVCPGRFVPVSPMMDGSEESQSHLALHALLNFLDRHGRPPKLHDVSEAEEALSIAKEINIENKRRSKANTETYQMFLEPENEEFPARLAPSPPPVPLTVDEVDESFIRTQSLVADAELQPLCAFFGAVVAQEIVKITGKYTPICQWFHFRCDAILASSALYTSSGDYKPTNSRYDHLIALLGKNFQKKLESLRVFMVGCGALGCENIKNFALCGVACGPNGSLLVTDNDRIEVSNLSRQFLFREENVGQPKSVAAAARMRIMNKDVAIDPRQDYVGATTEHLYHDIFWDGLDVVVNALDNMETRLYVDQQCVKFQKILVEAGTMGTGGNVDIIVPGKTTSYADGGAADASGGIPMCTLRNFPYIFDHCIEWSRAQFDDLFVFPMQTVEQLVEDPTAFKARIEREINAAQSSGERLSLVEKHLGILHPLQKVLSNLSSGVNMEKCFQCAWELMFYLFRDRIMDLQRSFPRDAKKKNGEDFWSGHRKYPTALNVDPKTIASNKDAVEFLIAASNLFACMYGVHPPKHEPRFNDANNRWMQQYRSLEWINKIIEKREVPVYHPGAVEGLDDDILDAIQTHDGAKKEETKEEQLGQLLCNIMTLAGSCRGTKATPLDFEKDDDDNFHIDFVTAASNLRASNYDIPTQDRMKVKLVAGKIIPAIATTTSAVTGLALIEYFKALQGNDISCLRNGMIDVGTNNYVLFERDAPIKNRTKIVSTYLPEQDYTYKKKLIRVPDGFTKYDSIDVPITIHTTVQQFATMLENQLNALLPAGTEGSCEIVGIGVGHGMLWNGSKKHANTNLSLMQLIEQQKMTEAGGKLSQPFWQNRTQFCELSVTVSLDDGDTSVDEADVETAMIRLRITQ